MMSNEEVQEKFAKFRETLPKAIEKAKAAGLPNDNIKRAIEKGAGAGASDSRTSVPSQNPSSAAFPASIQVSASIM